MRDNKVIYPDAENFVEVAALGASVDAGTHNVALGDQITVVNLPAKASGDLTVQLPKVGEARGFFGVYVAAAGGAGATAIVAASSDSFNQGTLGTLATLTAAGDYVLLYSDGFSWSIVSSKITA